MSDSKRQAGAVVVGSVVVLLLAVSAVLQYLASIQRWVVAGGSWTRTDRLVEDHLFDYYFPSEPWEPIGSAATQFGVGYTLIAVALLLLPFMMRGRMMWWGLLFAAAAALTFALIGIHAAWSGVLGVPSPMMGLFDSFGEWWARLSLGSCMVGFVGLLVVLARGGAKAWIPSLLLLGPVTLWGYLAASLGITGGFIAGSYDTSRWAETVLAVWTAMAALAALMVVILTAVRKRRVPTFPYIDGRERSAHEVLRQVPVSAASKTR